VGGQKRIYLEMFLSRLEILGENIFREIAAFGIISLLKQYEYQILALHIVNKALPHLRPTEITSVLTDIANFVDINRPDCRDLMFEILMFIKQKNEQSADDLKLVKQILLRGLAVESDDDITNRIFKFWSSNEEILSAAIDKRLTDLMGQMYDVKSEKRFISICAQYLLDIPINNPNSKRQICQFQNELSIKLVEYQLDTSNRRLSSRATPLFVESQQRNLLDGEGSQQMHYVLKQTQDGGGAGGGLFEPTQDPQTMSQTSNSFTLSSQNSLLFRTSSLVLDRRSQLSDSRPVGDKQQTSQILENLARGNEKRRYFRPAIKTGPAKSKEKVTLYRRYRYGDYPDLLINDLALLMPLQALVKRDNKLARIVLVEVFKSVVAEITPDRLQELLRELNTGIQTIISQTVNCDYTLYATIMELAIGHAKQIDLPPDVVAITAKVSNMMILGVLYLEKRLGQGDLGDDEASTSKTNSTSVSVEDFCWYKLSELYSGLAETEISSGILTDKLKFSVDVARAEGMQLDGDHHAAYKEYQRLVEAQLFSSTVEQNFCYASFYDCFVEMGMWPELFETVQKAVDTYAELWTDDFNQEHVLPHLIRSEQRLLLYGQLNDHREFQRTMDEWLRDPDKAEYIKMTFGEELTMLYIAHGDVTTARVYSENMLRLFFAEWEKLSVLSDKVRAAKLMSVRKVAEIHNCSKFLLDAPSAAFKSDLTAVGQAWRRSAIDVSDSVTLWDNIVVTRHYIVQTLLNRLDVGCPEASRLYQSVVDTNFQLLEVAIAQKNTVFSDKLTARIEAMCDNPAVPDSRSLKLRLELLRGKLQTAKASHWTSTRSHKMLIGAWTRIQNLVDTIATSPAMMGVKVAGYEELSVICKRLFSTTEEFDEQLKADIGKLATSNQAETTYEKLYQHSLWCLNNAMNLCQSVEDEDVDAKLVGKIFFAISQFRYELYNNEKVPRVSQDGSEI
jgi:DNA-dependent protein kinase catalytic subunit